MCKDWNAKIEINSWGSYILVRKVDDFDWTYYLGSDLKYILVVATNQDVLLLPCPAINEKDQPQLKGCMNWFQSLHITFYVHCTT